MSDDSQRPSKPDDTAQENVYSGVYRVLLGGMLISTALFAIGTVRALLQPEFVPLTPEWVRSHYNVSAVIRGLAHLDPMVTMMVATVLLILTPVARVLVSIVAFAIDGDRKFVAITGLVFLIMIATVVLGLLGLK